MDELPRSRVLVKDGKWCVPKEERPKNWRDILPEQEAATKTLSDTEPASPTPSLDQVIAATEEAKEAEPPQSDPSEETDPSTNPDWIVLRDAIRESGAVFCGKEDKNQTITAGLVLAAGMWTRDLMTIRRMTRAVRVAPIMRRCYDQGLWNREDRVVVLGEMDGENGDLCFWLNAMAANGEITRHANDTYSAITKGRR